jgi:hypothetical protein
MGSPPRTPAAPAPRPPGARTPPPRKLPFLNAASKPDARAPGRGWEPWRGGGGGEAAEEAGQALSTSPQRHPRRAGASGSGPRGGKGPVAPGPRRALPGPSGGARGGAPGGGERARPRPGRARGGSGSSCSSAVDPPPRGVLQPPGVAWSRLGRLGRPGSSPLPRKTTLRCSSATLLTESQPRAQDPARGARLSSQTSERSRFEVRPYLQNK